MISYLLVNLGDVEKKFKHLFDLLGKGDLYSHTLLKICLIIYIAVVLIFFMIGGYGLFQWWQSKKDRKVNNKQQRIPFTKFRNKAIELGWTANNEVNEITELINELRQLALDDDMIFWGRPYSIYGYNDPVNKKPLQVLPKEHWEDHFIDLVCWTASANTEVYTQNGDEQGFVDIHIESKVLGWLNQKTKSYL